MLVKEIFKNIEFDNNCGCEDVEIGNLAFNTSDVKENSLYFCLEGTNVDGHSFAKEAIKRGASCLVVQRFLPISFPQIKVDDCRKALALASGNFFGNPAQKLHLIGITGTNGKTSSTYILKSILESCGKKVGVIGTLGVVIGNKHYPSDMTTPDPTKLHKIFFKMVQSKVEYVVMEVSAHALDLKKLSGLTFDVGVLTNITQDHLDYFKTFSRYALTKLDFISPNYCKTGVVNLDDKLALTLFNKYKNSEFCCKGFGVDNKSDIFPNYYKLAGEGVCFNCGGFGYNQQYKTKLVGKFNLYNILGCVAVAKALGLDAEKVKVGIEQVLPIPGRFNVEKLCNGAFVVIDYAHTPDGLQKVLSSAREICEGRLFCVFGCGGNRDKTKRPVMGEISGKLADYTIITSDNPRFENPESIINDIKCGLLKVTSNFKCITDRTKAIEYCVKLSKEKDVILIAGKGAENYLDVKGQKVHYSDFEVVESLKKGG